MGSAKSALRIFRVVAAAGALLLGTFATGTSASAEDPREVEATHEPAPVDPRAAPANVAVSPPAGLGQKQRLSDDDFARKNEGGYFTGLPIFNYDPNTGFGFGGRLYYYFDGAKKDPLFAYTPYLDRLIVQAFISTGGAQDQLLDYDAPDIFGTLWRARATLEYEAATNWPYYGIGSRSLAHLSFPGQPGVTYARASAYEKATSAVQPNGQTYALYNEFDLKHPTLQLGLERLLLGGVVRPFFGLGFSYANIHDYTGTRTNATAPDGASVKAPEATTFLAADCAAHRILGCNGGFDNVLRLALSVDTRDFEPDPNSGVYTELSTELATRALGSQYDYLRAMLSVRAFYSPVPKLADVVLAGRWVYEIQTSGTPFYSQETLPFIDDNHAGLGGFRTLRGFAQNRFVGPVIVLNNYEIRWTFVRFHLLGQGIGLMAVPFMDIGRVFDDVRQTTLAGWKRTEGGGLRIAWNEATIIMADYGFSSEGSGFYLNFNHIF